MPDNDINLRGEFEKLPFKSNEGDWRAYLHVETAADALALLTDGANESRRPVWVHLPLTRLIADGTTAKIDEHAAFVEVGAGVQRWLAAETPPPKAIYHIEFRGWRNKTLALVFDDAVYVWSPDGI